MKHYKGCHFINFSLFPLNTLFASALFISFLFVSTPSFSDQRGVVLTVHVSGATYDREQTYNEKADEGQAILSLFSSPDNYLTQPIISEVKPVNKSGKVVFTLGPVKAGTYAVSIIYDENGDGELNTSFFGIPTELVGFSNNVKGTFGPPSYRKASFILSSSKTISIVLGEAKE